MFYRVKETHLLSRLIKVCLKETVERFHVFLFSKQHMIGQILQNLKRITNIKLSSHELATSYNLAKKGKQGIYSTTLFFKVNLEFGSVSFRGGGSWAKRSTWRKSLGTRRELITNPCMTLEAHYLQTCPITAN